MNKLLSCHYNMDTNRVEARFEDGTTLAIDCIAIEDEYCCTISRWSMHRWCWVGRLSVICHWDATTAGWKIDLFIMAGIPWMVCLPFFRI